MMRPGQVLRQLRKEKGLTLQQAAPYFGMSHQNLSNIERGKGGIYPSFLERAVRLYKPSEETEVVLNDAISPMNERYRWPEQDSDTLLISRQLPDCPEQRLENLLRVIHTEPKMITLSYGMQADEWKDTRGIYDRLKELDLERIPSHVSLIKIRNQLVQYGFAMEKKTRRAQRRAGSIEWRLSNSSEVAGFACAKGLKFSAKTGNSVYEFLGHFPINRSKTIEGIIEEPNPQRLLRGLDKQNQKKVARHIQALQTKGLVIIQDSGCAVIASDLKHFHDEVLKPIRQCVYDGRLPPIENPTVSEYREAVGNFYRAYRMPRRAFSNR